MDSRNFRHLPNYKKSHSVATPKIERQLVALQESSITHSSWPSPVRFRFRLIEQYRVLLQSIFSSLPFVLNLLIITDLGFTCLSRELGTLGEVILRDLLKTNSRACVSHVVVFLNHGHNDGARPDAEATYSVCSKSVNRSALRQRE